MELTEKEELRSSSCGTCGGSGMVRQVIWTREGYQEVDVLCDCTSEPWDE